MFSGGIDILMSQNIGDEIDVSGFFVEVGTVGTAQLMRSDMLDSSDKFRILSYQVFYGSHPNPFLLQ